MLFDLLHEQGDERCRRPSKWTRCTAGASRKDDRNMSKELSQLPKSLESKANSVKFSMSPVDGMAGGARGECQLPHGLSVDARFPAV